MENTLIKGKKFLITGGAGFIGSNLVAFFMDNGADKVRVLDNLSTGFVKNIEKYIGHNHFEFIEGDIRNITDCQNACEGIDYVLHQAALGSVPRSINDPLTTNEVNITGFLNMLIAAKDQKIKRMVYAASSSTYGDSQTLPKIEPNIGMPLSPYAVTKYVNELYAHVFALNYGLETIGLRYFNVYGPNQNPEGAYAAVIPLFMKAVMNGEAANINGDGEQSRDFTYIDNVVQANIKALFVDNMEAVNTVYNIAVGERTSLNELWQKINGIAKTSILPKYRENRPGDVRHSLADIGKASKLLGYLPNIKIDQGLQQTYSYFSNKYAEQI